MKSASKIKRIRDMLKNKKASCEEITKEYLKAIDKYNANLNAYVTITHDTAIKTAKKVDTKIKNKEDLMPLEGIPMTLKDNISTKGIKTTCCSKMLKDYIPIYDSTVYKILKEHNSILLGKTNMDEFAMGSTCETSYFKGCANPHNLDYVPGGSSGGGACAVAGNLAVFALGSDTGGSIREPSSFCGVVGLKPTYGAVSRYGLIAFASSFDQIGPITSCAYDCACVYDAISIQDKMDCTCTGSHSVNTLDFLNNGINGLKIGVVKEFMDCASDTVRISINNAISVLKSLGAQIINISMPEISHALPIYYILACAEASSNLARYDGVRYGYRAQKYNSIDEMICKTRSEGFGKEVKRRILFGTYVLSSEQYNIYYKKAQKLRGLIIQSFNDTFKSCDVILSPTSPSTAKLRGAKSNDPTANYKSDLCTVSVNIAGLPAISVPCGFDKLDLPIGMQIIGKKFAEPLILNIANMYERATENAYIKNVNMGVLI